MRDALAQLPIPPALLVALVGVLAALVLPHTSNLGAPVIGFFYVAVAWRLLAVSRPRLMPGRWLLLLLLPGALALVVATAGLHDGRLAGTALLVVMLGLKLLELRARRDLHVALYLGYFVVLTQFLYDQSMWLALYLFAGVALLVAIQIGLNRVAVDARRQLQYAGAALLGALPLALLLFFVFPRLHSPLWAISAPSALTGISGEMTLGNIGELTRSNEVAFRVQFFGAVPDPDERYWRGPVLWETDGRRWTAGVRPLQTPPAASGLQRPVDYEMVLEPTGEYWLFGLDIVTEPPPGGRLNRNFALVGEQRVNKRLSYRARSDPGYRIEGISLHERHLGLQLPAELSPRVRALVERWQRETPADRPGELVQKALAYFAQEPFVYTLSPGVLDGDPIDRFLFETRRGFCEHYAGAFVLLMRIAGIPSRVVVGYQGGERNPHADHWVIRQSDAHAWAEVYLPGRGWSRVDPTAAVAPQRIEQPINAALSEGADRVVFRTAADGVLTQLWRNAAWFADAVDLGWHRWVIGFSADRQASLLATLGLDHLRGYGLALLLLGGGVLTTLAVYLASRLPRRPAGDPLPRLWRRYLDRLRRAGVPAADWHGPDTVCSIACARFPGACAQITAINRLYIQLRYGRRQDAGQVGHLRRRIRRLRLRA